MATQNQLAANRRNAQKSTGPSTQEGLAAVRLNGIKHGLTAQNLVLRDESINDFEALFDSIEAEHQPATPTEVAIVRRIDLKDKLEEYSNLSVGASLAVIVHDDTGRANTLDNISRYEGRLELSLDKALRELERLRSMSYKKMQKQSRFAPRAPSAPENQHVELGD